MRHHHEVVEEKRALLAAREHLRGVLVRQLALRRCSPLWVWRGLGEDYGERGGEREERGRECWKQEGGELGSQREDRNAVHDVGDGAEGAHHTVEFRQTRMEAKGGTYLEEKDCTKAEGASHTV